MPRDIEHRLSPKLIRFLILPKTYSRIAIRFLNHEIRVIKSVRLLRIGLHLPQRTPTGQKWLSNDINGFPNAPGHLRPRVAEDRTVPRTHAK